MKKSRFCSTGYATAVADLSTKLHTRRLASDIQPLARNVALQRDLFTTVRPES